MAHPSRALYVALASSTVLLLLLAVGPTPAKSTKCYGPVQQYLERSCRCGWETIGGALSKRGCPGNATATALRPRDQFLNLESACTILAGLAVPPLFNATEQTLHFNLEKCQESLTTFCFGLTPPEEDVELAFTDRTIFSSKTARKRCSSCNALSKNLADLVCNRRKCICPSPTSSATALATTPELPECSTLTPVVKDGDDLTVAGETFDFKPPKLLVSKVANKGSCNCVEECEE